MEYAQVARHVVKQKDGMHEITHVFAHHETDALIADCTDKVILLYAWPEPVVILSAP